MNKKWCWIIALSLALQPLQLNAQVPDDFLEEDEFEEPPAPPTGSFPPPPPIDEAQPPVANDFPPPQETAPGGFNSGGGVNPAFNANKKRRKVPFSQAQPEDITNENFPDIIESFDFPNAEISDIVKAISELTGKNFIVEPNVRGRITIIAPTPITVAEAYKAFLSALAINGFTVVPSGKFLKIRPIRAAAKDSMEIYTGAYTPNTDQLVTRIIHLRHISADEVNKSLRTLISKDGDLLVYGPTNSVILSDFGSSIERIMKVIRQLDVPGFEEQMEVIKIRHAKAKEIADLIDQIINKGESKKQGRGFTTGIPRFNRQADQVGGNNAFSLVIPDERTNAIIVVGNKEGIRKIKDLVKKLDYDLAPEDAGGVYVYYVKYGEAEKLAEALNGVAKEKKTETGRTTGPIGDDGFPPPPAPINNTGSASSGQAGVSFGGAVKITSSKETNSLIITASRQDYEVVLALLGKLDIPRDQVYVEAVIMELDAQQSNEWNPTYYAFAPETKGVGRIGFSSGNIASLLSPAGDQGAVLGFGSGTTFKINTGQGEVEVTSFVSFLNFIKKNINSNILSQPQILAMNNEESEIEVGVDVPIGTKTTQTGTAPAVTSTERQKASIKLTLTPYISPASDQIRMKINQVVRQVAKQNQAGRALADSTVTLSERNVKTNIVVNNGDTAVIGGLMREDEQLDETKVPILGDIPIIGWLFKRKAVEKKKFNLLVFISPKIIRTTNDAKTLMGDRLTERLDYIKSSYGGRDPFGSKVDKMIKKGSNRKLDTMSE